VAATREQPAEEIAGRVRAMREADSSILPPLLLLGVMERVGSNWVSDTLRPVTGQHNEPFRQQVGPAHPLSALNPGLSPGGSWPDLGPYGRHWLVTFAAAKHAPVRQVIKETNLFFALPALLSLFPGSPVAVLTRSPLGVASSFARGDLFRRWGYRARYRQLTAMTTRPELAGWAAVVPDDDPPDLVALARLQVLNSLIIASAARPWCPGRPGGHPVRGSGPEPCFRPCAAGPAGARGTRLRRRARCTCRPGGRGHVRHHHAEGRADRLPDR
jgi:hypothetical protein